MIEIIKQEDFIAGKFGLNQALIDLLSKYQAHVDYCNVRFRKFLDRKRGVYPKCVDRYADDIVKCMKGQNPFE